MITNEAIERRLMCLEYGHNDYFKAGMQAACEKAKANGFTIKSFDENNYPYLDQKQASNPLSIADIFDIFLIRRTQKAALTRLSEYETHNKVDLAHRISAFALK